MREKENMGNGNAHADANALTFINKLGLVIMLTCTEIAKTKTKDCIFLALRL